MALAGLLLDLLLRLDWDPVTGFCTSDIQIEKFNEAEFALIYKKVAFKIYCEVIKPLSIKRANVDRKLRIVGIGRFWRFWRFQCKLECKWMQKICKNVQYQKPSHAFK